MIKLLQISKSIHKYLGLVLFLFIAWMSLSGILLNHPEIISNLSVPKWMVPENYLYDDWSRSALVDVVYPEKHTNIYYAGGREGVWVSSDSGKTFTSLNKNGYPESRHYRRTTDLIVIGDSANYSVLAGNYAGIFKYNPIKQLWSKIGLDSEHEKVLKFLEDDKKIYAVTNSKIYAADKSNLDFRNQNIARKADDHELMMTEVFFEIHSGKAWGLPGQLILDIVGLILFFLSISGIIIWYLPKRVKKKLRAKIGFNPVRSLTTTKTFYKYHLKLGIWVSVVLLLLAATGFFMRPPFIVAITDLTLAEKYYPGISHDNPWHLKIRNAMIDNVTKEIIIDATDGRWRGSTKENATFTKEESPLPIFVMGATVFEKQEGKQIIGSFNGLYAISDYDGEVQDLIEGKSFDEIDPVRPGKYMMTGYFILPDSDTLYTTHQHGVHTLGDNSKRRGRFTMPDEILAEYRMPLWSYMFELHNGRIFKGLFGSIYILILPLGSLLAFLIFASGIYDWFKK